MFEAAVQAGARQAYLIEEPMAAAMGADLPVTEPTGSMVVDIGGGTTEVAVISLGGIVTSSSLRLAGNRMDEAIAMHLRDLLGIKIGERTAEIIKIKIGSILPFEDGRERDMIISGQDVITEQPKEVTIQSEDVRSALVQPCEEMVVHIKETFKKTNPDLASDIIQNGILLTGASCPVSTAISPTSWRFPCGRARRRSRTWLWAASRCSRRLRRSSRRSCARNRVEPAYR